MRDPLATLLGALSCWLAQFSEACICCPFLRLDPAQLPRLQEIETNARTRLAEARQQTWLSEVAALEENLRHIATNQNPVPRIRELRPRREFVTSYAKRADRLY